jgi:N-acetylneuraminic acid mutarotase
MKNLFYKKICLIIIFLWLFSIYLYSQNGWKNITTLPTVRVASYAAVIGEKIYVIGGTAVTMADIDDNEVFNTYTCIWENLAPMTTPRGFLTGAVVNDIIYAIGGGYPTRLDKNEAYDPATDTWTPKADLPAPRRKMQSAVVDEIIYVIGGNGFERNCFAFNPDSNKWTEKTPIPEGGGGDLAVAVYNGLIYTFGGGFHDTGGPKSNVYAYNPQTDEWIQKTSMQTARFALQAYVIGDKIYAIGGSQSYGTALSIVEVYDPVNDTWEQKTDMPEPLCFFAGVVVNNKIYVISGTSDWLRSDGAIWEYDPALDPTTGVEKELTTPTEFILYQNYPNPFNPSTVISYQLAVGSRVTLKVYDILGNEVATLVNEEKAAGTYEVTWNAEGLSSGVYFYQLKAGEFTATKKLLLLR